MEVRNVKVSLEKAKEWYKSEGTLKEIALQAFTKDELEELPTREEISDNVAKNMVQQGDKVLVSDDGIYWELALYFEMDVCFYFDGTAASFKYIVPFNSFDISVNDITENCKKSIVW